MWYKLTILFSGTWNLRLIEQFLSFFLNKRLYYLRRKVLVVVFRLLSDNGKKTKNHHILQSARMYLLRMTASF